MEPGSLDPSMVLALVSSALSIGFSAGLYVGAIRGIQRQVDSNHSEELNMIQENRRAIEQLRDHGPPGARAEIDGQRRQLTEINSELREMRGQLNRLERSTIVRLPRRPDEGDR